MSARDHNEQLNLHYLNPSGCCTLVMQQCAVSLWPFSVLALIIQYSIKQDSVATGVPALEQQEGKT